MIRKGGGVYPQGRARAEMVLVTFAETKVTRRVGAKAHMESFHPIFICLRKSKARFPIKDVGNDGGGKDSRK